MAAGSSRSRQGWRSAATPRGQEPVRLLSYNIHKGIGGVDRKYRLERVIEVIEEQNPDLLCLQEVTKGAARTSRDDQPRLLADYFHAASHFYQMNVHYKR